LPKPIQEKARNVYGLWSNNPRHPSLRFKKVHIKLPIYSVRIDIDWRAVGILDGDQEFKFAPVRARFFKVRLLSNHQNDGRGTTVVHEFRLFGRLE